MSYLDRLQGEYDTISEGITAVLERAADEGRDLSADETAQIERDDKRRGELEQSIAHYASLAERDGRVSAVRAKVPASPMVQRTVAEAIDGDAELLRMFPTPGDFVATVHRAWAKKDREAIALLERAGTAHQKLADNPGIIPVPIVAPVVDRMLNMRPFISSVGVNAAPAPKFDRPVVTQQVDVDVQAAEKDPTASQVLKTVPVPVTLATYAGHLNISKQDIRWSQPSILGLVYESFAKVYARRTDKAAAAAFVAGITATGEIATLDAAGIDAALGAAGDLIGGADGDLGEPNHVWLSRDMAVSLASLRNPTTGEKLYDIPLIGGTSGDLDGLSVTIDGRFADGTFIVGDSSLVEYWEDLEGFMSVDEPDVLGQLVGYAGYGSLAILDKAGFVKLTVATP